MVANKIKDISDLSFKAKNSKDNEKIELDNKVKDMLFKLKKQAIDHFQDESDLKKFLDNMINFNNYSFNNSCLIALQNKEAKYVASELTFSKMGYKKLDEEIGMKILVPSFLSFVKIKESNGYVIKPLYLLTKEERQKYKDPKDKSIIFYKKKLTHFNVGTVYDASQTNMPLDIINEKLNPILENVRADDITDNFIKAIYKDGIK